MLRAVARLRARTLAFQPTPATASTVMAVCNPFEHNLSEDSAMLVAPPLLHAIRQLGEESRPLRIVSHETYDGRAFNCAYFSDAATFVSYRKWFASEALTAGGEYHAAHKLAFEDPSEMPSSVDTWLWGVGKQTLSDTRTGEYQIGFGTRYSRMLFRSAEARAEAEATVLTPAFERRLKTGMEAAGIAYHGRLVMVDEGGDQGGWFTTTRYGSREDAHRGTAAVRMLLADEMERWFASYETITGSIASTWLVTPPPREVGRERAR